MRLAVPPARISFRRPAIATASVRPPGRSMPSGWPHLPSATQKHSFAERAHDHPKIASPSRSSRSYSHSAPPRSRRGMNAGVDAISQWALQRRTRIRLRQITGKRPHFSCGIVACLPAMNMVVHDLFNDVLRTVDLSNGVTPHHQFLQNSKHQPLGHDPRTPVSAPGMAPHGANLGFNGGEMKESRRASADFDHSVLRHRAKSHVMPIFGVSRCSGLPALRCS